jgi:hypothetical protein
MSIRERAEYVLDITEKRFDRLLPGMMRETGLDMWIITGNEDAHDPLFWTMMPYKNWAPKSEAVGMSRQNCAGAKSQAYRHQRR